MTKRGVDRTGEGERETRGGHLSITSFLYRLARLSGDTKAIASGDPKRIGRRAKNKLLGRSLGRRGVWRWLWK